jgi:hypothetical protein
LLASSIGLAQTVTPPSTPANSVQNAGNTDLACGSGAVAQPGTGTTALGINAKAFAFSTALGAGAQATAANQMMLGTATNILAAPGLVSAASKAAQKGKVLRVTVDANGNLATAAVPRCRCPPIVRPTKPVSPKRR